LTEPGIDKMALLNDNFRATFLGNHFEFKGDTMSLIIQAGANAISYDELRAVQTPEGTETHIPVPHHEIVELMRYTLGFFGHEIAEEHHAITPDGAPITGAFHWTIERPTTPNAATFALAGKLADRPALTQRLPDVLYGLCDEVVVH
jgi:hypothetical protein